jgi:hypothetical protein
MKKLNDRVINFLEKSVETLQKYQWCRCSLAKDTSGCDIDLDIDRKNLKSVCSLGAIEYTGYRWNFSEDIVNRAKFAIKQELDTKFNYTDHFKTDAVDVEEIGYDNYFFTDRIDESITDFNDDVAKDKRSVISLFNRTIKNLKKNA